MAINYHRVMSDDECYAEGWEAFEKGVRKDENPYAEGTLSFEIWLDGWEGASDKHRGYGEPDGDDDAYNDPRRGQARELNRKL